MRILRWASFSYALTKGWATDNNFIIDFFPVGLPPPPPLYFMTSPQTISKSEGKVIITTKFYRVVFLTYSGALTKSDSREWAGIKERMIISLSLICNHSCFTVDCFPGHMISYWGVEEVGNWLESLGLSEYKENFESHDIRGNELLNLTRGDLKVLVHQAHYMK